MTVAQIKGQRGGDTVDVLWEIRLLGGLRLTGPKQEGDEGKAITRFPTRKAAALLARLAYSAGTPQRREELIEILWPGARETEGRGNLAVQLHHLRKLLEPSGSLRGVVLSGIGDPHFITLNADVVSVDVAMFEAAARRARHAEDPARRLDHLTRALDTYTGKLLPEFDQLWVEPARLNLANRYQEIAEDVIPLLEPPERALEYAHRAVTCDPDREAAYRLLMHALLRAGQRTAVLNLYESLKRRLAETGSKPSEKTREIARAARENRPLPSPPPTGTVALLVTDIEGSTALERRLGGTYKMVWERHNALLRHLFERHDGTKFKQMGDGFWVAFAKTSAALTCAVAGQQALAAEAWPEIGYPLPVRMAVHVGAADWQDGDYYGLTLNKASRLLSAAHGGQILASEAAEALSRHDLTADLQITDLGMYCLRGFPPERFFQVCFPEMPRRLFPAPNAEPFEPPPAEERPAAETGLFTVPYGHNPFFVGRRPILDQIHQMLTDHADAPIALVGMSGLGKTQLAVEYAHEQRQEYPGGIFWIHARDTARLRESYAAIGRLVFRLAEDLSTEAAAEQVRVELQRLSRPALLLFDNVTADTDLHLLPASGPCRILITSCESGLPEHFRVLLLPRLDEASAIELLQRHRRVENEAERIAAVEIAERVGHFPLALTLVAHHVKRLDSRFSSYQKRLTQDLPKALAQARERFTAATGHDGRLFDTIHVSCDSLHENARTILSVACCFYGRGIPFALLYEAARLTMKSARGVELEEDDFRDSIAHLMEDYCLVEREEPKEGEESGRLTVHELVRVFMNAQSDAETQRAAAESVAFVLTAPLEAANAEARWQQILPEIAHARAALTRGYETRAQTGFYSLLREIGIYLYYQKEASAALRHLEKGLTISDTLLGRQHYEAARFLTWIGLVRQDLGQKEAALAASREALEIAQATLPGDDPALAEQYNNLGSVLQSQDRFDEALDVYRTALAICESAYGENHPHVATCRNNIGVIHYQREEWDEALCYLLEALSIDQMRYGLEHPKAAIRHNLIGRILVRTGIPREALFHHRKALRIYRMAYGDCNLDVAMSHRFLAEAWRSLGRTRYARRHGTHALVLCERLYGPENPRSTVLREMLASLREE